MIEQRWLEKNQKHPAVETDESVIMPNPLLGVVVTMDTIVGGPPACRFRGRTPGSSRRTRRCAPTDGNPMAEYDDNKRIYPRRKNRIPAVLKPAIVAT
jgi:hypothetical protein